MSDRTAAGPTLDRAVARPANPIALSDIVRLPVAPHWAEAVAVVEELCTLVETDDTGAALVPELADLVITSRGGVMVRKGARMVRDVHQLGRILYTLLKAGTAPKALRLFAAHAMTSSKYATVNAYAEALAYYARPGRQDLIRALYDRCLEVPLENAPAHGDGRGTAVLPIPARRRARLPGVVVALALVGLGTVTLALSGAVNVSSVQTAVRNLMTSGAEMLRLVPPSASAPQSPPDARSTLRGTGLTPTVADEGTSATPDGPQRVPSNEPPGTGAVGSSGGGAP